jgi:hypothetical protein
VTKVASATAETTPNLPVLRRPTVEVCVSAPGAPPDIGSGLVRCVEVGLPLRSADEFTRPPAPASFRAIGQLEGIPSFLGTPGSIIQRAMDDCLGTWSLSRLTILNATAKE